MVFGALAVSPAAASAATITVSSPDDNLTNDSTCTLREAVIEANTDGADPIDDCVFSPVTLGNDTINLTTSVDLTTTGEDSSGLVGDLDVTDIDGLTIDGTGAQTINQTEIGDDQRVFEVILGDVELTLSDLTVTGGSLDSTAASVQGGNILVNEANATPRSALTLDDVDVTNGQAVNPTNSRGGNIHASKATVTITGGSITGGVANAGPAVGGRGGGINVDGDSTLSITGTYVSGNMAGVGATAGKADGGGVRFNPNPVTNTMSMTDVVVDGNQAGGVGGSLSAQGGGVLTTSPATITGGAISDNIAGGGSGDAQGTAGGVFAAVSGDALTLDDVDVTGNQAGGNGGDGFGNAGGIYAFGGLDVVDSTISGNEAGVYPSSIAIGQGGGIVHESAGSDETLSVVTSTISVNRAGTSLGSGAGIVDYGLADLLIEDSVLSNNQAVGDDEAYGGGLYRQGESVGGNDTITGTKIAGNTATGVGTATSLAAGGGIYWTSPGTLSVDGSTVSSNTASSASTTVSGSGGGANLVSGAAQGEVSITNSTFHGNTATGLTAGGNGGGIRLSEVGPELSALIESSTIASNTAGATGGGGFGGNLSAAGAMDSGLTDIEGSIISHGNGVSGSENCAVTATGILDSIGGSVEGPNSGGGVATDQCELNHASDLNADPLLGPLADNGGPDPGDPDAPQPLLTRALLSGSPAIDLVLATQCPPPAVDQRGFARPVGPRCDSGAFEVQPPAPPAGPSLSSCAGQRETSASNIGTPGRDVIVGTPARDVIRTLGGNDLVCGLGGNDLIVGGGGKDTLRGQAGKDTLKGGAKKDKLIGGGGRDTLIGGAGPDVLNGGPGADRQIQ